MNFKVGQRVRVVAVSKTTPDTSFIGKEATITAIPGPLPGDVGAVRLDGESRDHGADSWHYFAPLTDPAADAFMERIKKLKPYDEPKHVEAQRGNRLLTPEEFKRRIGESL